MKVARVKKYYENRLNFKDKRKFMILEKFKNTDL